MRNSLKFLLLGFLLTTILLLNISFISAAPACDIGYDEATCNSDGGVVLMRISGNTNAHGSLKSGPGFPSGRVVCCYDIPEGSDTCIGDNKIIGLSSLGNAHAERPEYDSQNYEDHVCYEFFNGAIATTTNPGGDYIPILSLSSTGNSHIGSSSAYSLVVYGLVGEGGGGEDECSLQDAYWENDEERINETTNYVLSGTSVELIVEGTEECEGEIFDFIIKENIIEDIPSGGEISGEIFSGGEVNATWAAQYMDLENRPPRYFFTGESGTTIESGKDSASLLTVYNNDEPRIVNFCSNYTDYFSGGVENPENEEICWRDPYEVAPASVPPGVNCDNTFCYCIWYNDECNGAYDTSEGTCIIEDQKIIEDCDEGTIGTMVFNWTATWTGDEGSRPIECKSGPKAIECPAEIPLPFFNAYNFVAALLLIAAVYFVLSFRKPKKRKGKK